MPPAEQHLHLHFHGASQPEADLRELMERMGHSSRRAPLIYLHSTPGRQRTLAEAIADRTRQDRAIPWHGRGTKRAG